MGLSYKPRYPYRTWHVGPTYETELNNTKSRNHSLRVALKLIIKKKKKKKIVFSMENAEYLLNETFERSSEETPVTVDSKSQWTILKLPIILLFVYLVCGILIYLLYRHEFTGIKTNHFVDALYFSIVTLSTVGYGDIVPSTSMTMILTIVLVSIGVIYLDFLLNSVVSYVLNLQEKAILARIETRNRELRDHIAENGRIKLKWRMCVAFGYVFCCVLIGALFVNSLEELDMLDSVYLSVISVSTVGYGDKEFKTKLGRIFAVFWLLSSNIAMANLFFCLAETRINRTTVMKLPMTESEYIVLKLIESGKVSEDDIKQITIEFQNRERVTSSGLANCNLE